jgi:hypothetical protein
MNHRFGEDQYELYLGEELDDQAEAAIKEIQELKEKYGDIYVVNLAGMDFIFRVINRAEYKNIYYQNLDLIDFQEEISKAGVVYPYFYNFSIGPGGVAETLCDFIMDISYLKQGQATEVLEYFRSEMEIFDNQADCLIHEAFPEFTLEEIENFTVEQTLYYLSRAEYILNTFRKANLVQIGKKEEYNEEEKLKEEYERELIEKEKIKQQRKSQNQKTNRDLTYEDMLNMPELKWFKAENELHGQ